MDKSEQYIKMCEKAEEIQKLWERKVGDFAVNVHYATGAKYQYVVCGQTWGKDFWLPRQDQLQEMLDNRFSNRYPWVMAEKFAHCSKPSTLGNGIFNMSMEQLWLAFVMKEKYNKVWAGDSWEATTI